MAEKGQIIHRFRGEPTPLSFCRERREDLGFRELKFSFGNLAVLIRIEALQQLAFAFFIKFGCILTADDHFLLLQLPAAIRIIRLQQETMGDKGHFTRKFTHAAVLAVVFAPVCLGWLRCGVIYPLVLRFVVL